MGKLKKKKKRWRLLKSVKTFHFQTVKAQCQLLDLVAGRSTTIKLPILYMRLSSLDIDALMRPFTTVMRKRLVMASREHLMMVLSREKSFSLLASCGTPATEGNTSKYALRDL